MIHHALNEPCLVGNNSNHVSIINGEPLTYQPRAGNISLDDQNLQGKAPARSCADHE